MPILMHFKGLGMENFVVFHSHLGYFGPLVSMFGHFVYFGPLVSMFGHLAFLWQFWYILVCCTKKNLATLDHASLTRDFRQI
jgi:hypothetical protein